jgi:hypothetical protein
VSRRAARGDDQPPQPFDVAQERGAALLGDDLPKQAAEQADVSAQRLRDFPARGLSGAWT